MGICLYRLNAVESVHVIVLGLQSGEGGLACEDLVGGINVHKRNR
jgi:hypothetical protein